MIVEPNARESQSQIILPIIQRSFERLIRGEEFSLSAYLNQVETHRIVDGTKVVCHCYFVALDGNGKPRVEALIEELCYHLIDYAIPRSSIAEAYERDSKNKTSSSILRLGNEARILFNTLSNSGEVGELLLFVLAETYLKLPQLICKMDLKTSTQMHFHGADGLHAGVDEASGKLCLYWCESKIWKNVSEAFKDFFDSLAPLLKGTGATSSLEQRDLQLLQRHIDLNDPKLEAALKLFLDPTNPNFNSLEFRGLGLVGFDFNKYPDTPGSKTSDEIAQEVINDLPIWKNHINSHVKSKSIDSYFMHVFCLPIPSSSAFRDIFRRTMRLDNVT